MKNLIISLLLMLSFIGSTDAQQGWTLLEKQGPNTRCLNGAPWGLDWNCAFSWNPAAGNTELSRGQLILQQELQVTVWDVNPNNPREFTPRTIIFWDTIDSSPIASTWSGSLGGVVFIDNMHKNRFRLKLIAENAPENPQNPLKPAWQHTITIFSDVWNLFCQNNGKDNPAIRE